MNKVDDESRPETNFQASNAQEKTDATHDGQDFIEIEQHQKKEYGRQDFIDGKPCDFDARLQIVWENKQ